MKLSVIIVNYNVKYFLEQCLYSVFKALTGIDGEVIVVDNNSVDGSEAMVRSRFPNVKLIINHENIGFAKANNQALKTAQGDYNLLLNPDTVLEESTFAQCLEFMDARPDVGSLGPKMINGKGHFLPESKRGLPTPEVAFYKVFGLTRLFAHSPRFGKYYLGHTSNEEIQDVDVLTGAFMLIRRKVLDQIGFFDEQYFMYGEDIDLSYRILKAGFKNVYFPKTTIIHYKGESTKKGSLNYIMLFYKAMHIFAEKHLSGKMVAPYLLLINLAIYFRAGLAVVQRFIVRAIPVLFDAIISYAGIYIITLGWEILHFHNSHYYPDYMLFVALPALVIVLVLSNALIGAYRAPFNLFKSIRGILYGTALVLVVYALLPDVYRFSRALIIYAAIWTLGMALFTRFLLSLTGRREYQLDMIKKRRIAIVGLEEESERIKKLLEMSGIVVHQIVCVFPKQTIPSEYFTGTLSQLKEILSIHSVNEVIFCAKDVSSQDIIDNMKSLSSAHVDFKIASPDSISVIGSNSSNSSGDLYVINVNSFNEKPLFSRLRKIFFK
jgi:O-antigen biosynthesis protein